MYLLLLAWRYLRTRYISLVSVVSVMLGVGALIVVNAVMAGFSHEAQARLHGVLSDLTFEARSLEGAPNAERHMAKIREIAGDQIAGMSPTVRVPAMLGYYVGDQYRTQQIMMIGIDVETDGATYANVSDFGRYLQHPQNREGLSFNLKTGGYDTVDHQSDDPSKASPRTAMEHAGWAYRRFKAEGARAEAPRPNTVPPPEPGVSRASPPAAEAPSSPVDPFQGGRSVFDAEVFDPKTDQHTGVVLGMALASYRSPEGHDVFLQLPGDDVEITYPSTGRPPKPLSAKFTVVDFYESKMQEYDASFCFVPLRKMQELRGMIDPTTGVANFNAIQIKLKEGADPGAVRDRLAAAFAPQYYLVSTWQDRQSALLSAIQTETMLLNILLMLIVVVAGFSILAIFFMIVVEKTREIGILKSLGASGGGVMGVFVSFGLALGVVGSLLGIVGGLVFVAHIDRVREAIRVVFGLEVFDPNIYYFHKIPTIVEPFTVGWITAGAVLIAVVASLLPAARAARMHPVAALRWN